MSEEQPAHIVGLDLGQSSDFTALTILERTLRPDTENDPHTLVSHYAARHLKRWALKTPYTAIVEDVVKLVAAPPLENPELAVDITGSARRFSTC